jgi:hypothetical protein
VDEEELDVEAEELRLVLVPVAAVEPAAPVEPAVLEWLRPIEGCHVDGVIVHDGPRRHQRPLAPWPHWGRHAWSPSAEQLLIGGAEEAHCLTLADGSWQTFASEPGANGLEVAWLDGVPVAAGTRVLAVGAARLACNLAGLVRAVAGGTLLVVADEDGLRVYRAAAVDAATPEPRLLARSWRTITAAFDDATGAPHVVTADGQAWRLDVRAA